MAVVQSWLSIILANTCLVVGIAVFAKAFFPYKPFLPGLAQFDDLVDSATPAPFDRLVFMLVDALRSDFVFSNESDFKFTQSLISAGFAVPFTAHAASPTVTMPRVKALTTGSIPGFLDMILNIAESDTSSTLTTQDNWLAQIKQSGKTLTMFGDDTWLKLFPNMFTRSDGTTSFFVSDFTEVDNNVTRHLDAELQAKDWDTMILHYLGLDHIGHKSGPRSQHMRPKQAEMDGVVKRIYQAMEQEEHMKSTLFILCGDHGMNDVGNHGGSSAGETSAALVFMSPKFDSKGDDTNTSSPTAPTGEFEYHDKIQQSDLVPTLASLLGFPIPKNNLGLFISNFLNLWSGEDQVAVLEKNAQQLVKLLIASHTDFPQKVSTNNCPTSQRGIDKLACAWRNYGEARIGNSDAHKENLQILSQFTRDAQTYLASAATKYDIPSMYYGIAIVTTGLFILAVDNLFFSANIIFTTGGIPFWITTIAYSVMMFASSFVEEEQLFWYWMVTALCCLFYTQKVYTKNREVKILGILILLRIVRRWNQTGQKHAGASDIVKDVLSKYPSLLWALIILTYTVLFRRIRSFAFNRLPQQMSFVLAGMPVLTSAAFKLSMATLDSAELIPSWLDVVTRRFANLSVIDQGKATFIITGFTLLHTILVEWHHNVKRRGNPNRLIIHTLLSILLITQSRLPNIPLFLCFHIIHLLLTSLSLPLSYKMLSILILQHVSFFALGNANAISSIDLSNSYNGVGGYNVVVVGILTFLSNWSGPIWWTSAGVLLYSDRPVEQIAAVKVSDIGVTNTADQSRSRAISKFSIENDASAFRQNFQSLTWFRIVTMLFVMVACVMLRTHLFIWTVFSPKFLFAVSWCFLQHIIVDGVFGGIFTFITM